MPVFHTKTIECILEPVAQQVSRLVILHEEAEDGNAMPDLSQSVRVVKVAVDNLVMVGHDTVNSSDDQILKQDMPPALKRVEESSNSLLEASELLKADPYSGPARKKLIEGSRGILQATSSLLLAFDESEVRKIIRVCKNVLEYVAITEVVDRMDDLVTFIKNLSPVLTRMTKEVDNREKELTHQVHRDMLIRSLEQVKVLIPGLISSIKMFISASESGQGVQEAQNNRDYTVRKISDEIHEIIRVLQLTTYDEDEWNEDDITVMKKAQNVIVGKMKPASDWLRDPAALVGSLGDKAVRQIIEDSRKVAERCTNAADAETILRSASNVESMVNALSELRQQGKGSSEPADSLSRSIQDQLTQLQKHTAQATITTERSGIRKPAPTVDGKVEQARQWLANPGLDDKGLGESATRLVVSEGQKVANCCTGPQKQELLKLCEESVILTHQLSDLKKKGQGNGPQAKAIARNLDEKLTTLKVKVQDAWVSQVQKYLKKNKHFPCPPLLDDNSREPLSEEDEGNKLLSEAVAVVIMMWDIIQKCWSDDVADRPSPHTLLNDVTDVQEKASTIEADTVIDKMKQVAYDIGMERKDMKTDVNKKLTVREIEAMLKTYLNKYYLDPSCLDMEGYKTKLGTGHYGAVYRGKMRSPEIYLDRRGQKSADDSPVHWTTVAIKRLKNYPGKGCIIDRRIVYKEIKVAVELDHPNVVKLLHLSTDRHIAEYDPMMIIMEYMNLGSLAKYAEKYGELSDAKRVSHMLKILLDVAEGMVYLSGKEIVHRDLAARNVLLCGWEGVRVTAKVSDFGLARMMEGNYRFYKLNTEDKMPFFWMPPECFPYEGTDKFSSKGDVWSFGIVMWEAFSKGARPDMVLPSDITFVQLLERYKSGWRLGGENIASKDAYSVMMGCWEMDPSRRPAFVELVLRLKKLILELHCF